MAYRRLFFFVEGEDDERFFKAVLLRLFAKRYDEIRFVQCSKLRNEKIDGFIRSVKRISGAEYLLVRDLDRLPCASAAKAQARRRYPQADPERIQIVKMEIESWYCAGIPQDDAEFGALGIATCSETEGVTKEAFQAAISRQGTPMIPTMLALLERFDRKRAAERNASFDYFLRKYARAGTKLKRDGNRTVAAPRKRGGPRRPGR